MKKSITTLAFLLLASGLLAQVIDVDRYLWEYPLQRNLSLNEELTDQLSSEMQKIINAGDLLFSPLACRYSDQIYDHYSIYQEPGRLLQTVALAYPYLTETQQNILRGMVGQLLADNTHTPWGPSPLSQNAGRQRELYNFDENWGLGSNFGQYRPTIQNVYSLWLYIYRTGDTATIQPYYNTIKNFYNTKVGLRVDPGNLYGTMSSHIGMARLAWIFDDEPQITLASGNLENYLTLGLEMNYVDSMAFYGYQGWNAPYGPEYDSRKDNWVYRGYIFLNLSPETGRFLKDHLFEEASQRHNQGINRFPFWWLRQAAYFTRWTGDEGIGLPTEMMGMVVPMERWLIGQNAQKMSSYLLSSPIGVADSYWIEALIYAIESDAVDLWVDVRETPFELHLSDYLLQISILLEGPYNGSNAMHTGLNTNNLIPLSQPYNNPPWNYNGTEEVITIPPDVVDWVLVELRDADIPENATPATTLSGWPKAFFLKNNGNIVDLNGNPLNIVGQNYTNNLYIVIRHRNHLDVMSSAPLIVSGNTYSYDFTDAVTNAYGGAAGYKQIGTGVYGMVAGDINADGAVFDSDFDNWTINFGLTTIYLPADMDLDGQVFVSDFNRWALNFGMNNSYDGTKEKLKSQVPN
jgi:hypothetical protein